MPSFVVTIQEIVSYDVMVDEAPSRDEAAKIAMDRLVEEGPQAFSCAVHTRTVEFIGDGETGEER